MFQAPTVHLLIDLFPQARPDTTKAPTTEDRHSANRSRAFIPNEEDQVKPTATPGRKRESQRPSTTKSLHITPVTKGHSITVQSSQAVPAEKTPATIFAMASPSDVRPSPSLIPQTTHSPRVSPPLPISSPAQTSAPLLMSPPSTSPPKGAPPPLPPTSSPLRPVSTTPAIFATVSVSPAVSSSAPSPSPSPSNTEAHNPEVGLSTPMSTPEKTPLRPTKFMYSLRPAEHPTVPLSSHSGLMPMLTASSFTIPLSAFGPPTVLPSVSPLLNKSSASPPKSRVTPSAQISTSTNATFTGPTTPTGNPPTHSGPNSGASETSAETVSVKPVNIGERAIWWAVGGLCGIMIGIILGWFTYKIISYQRRQQRARELDAAAALPSPLPRRRKSTRRQLQPSLDPYLRARPPPKRPRRSAPPLISPPPIRALSAADPVFTHQYGRGMVPWTTLTSVSSSGVRQPLLAVPPELLAFHENNVAIAAEAQQAETASLTQEEEDALFIGQHAAAQRRRERERDRAASTSHPSDTPRDGAFSPTRPYRPPGLNLDLNGDQQRLGTYRTATFWASAF
ncbi:hypothetical protein PYCC9005_000622 [Savitreella phatthalungensis]